MAPIGISFMPSADNQQNGPRQGSLEGPGNTDLAQAFKILSLHLPRVLGAQAIAPKKLLESQGSAGIANPSGGSPSSAIFEALLRAMSGGQMGASSPSALTPSFAPIEQTGPSGPPLPAVDNGGGSIQTGPDSFLTRGGGQY